MISLLNVHISDFNGISLYYLFLKKEKYVTTKFGYLKKGLSQNKILYKNK
jgi:hypothetical protein